MMFAAVTTWPTVTLTPLSFSVPRAGSVVIFTASSEFAPLSAVSYMPKSPVAKLYVASSLMVSVAGEPAGASFTAVIVMFWRPVLLVLVPSLAANVTVRVDVLGKSLLLL